MGVGRYVCVALPFILTVASIICMLIAGLTGVTSNDLYMFRINITDLQINATELTNVIDTFENLTSREAASVVWHDNDLVEARQAPAAAPVSGNITAKALGLDNVYDFTLWGYCVTPDGGKKNCTKAKFDWAESELNLDWLDTLNTLTGLNVTIPDSIDDSLTLFKTVSRWTQIVYIIAMVALGLELAVGLFTACSRAVSCITWLISGFATLAVIAAAAMMTATGAVVTGSVLGVAHWYGVKANLNTTFLAVIWLGAAFAIGAGLFWLFSICCCKPENRPYHKRSRHGGSESEKFLPTGSYAPIGASQHNTAGGYHNYGVPQRGGARNDLAYEPYSHSRV
ncbi:SUR7 protein [Xylariomycetidae sp. FL2044]|nr:SUR7 protein [Xylariomycetidae sp. FL2044]